MILHLEQAVPRQLCESIAARLREAKFVDGTGTAGSQDDVMKRNLQLPLRNSDAKEISRDLTRALSDSEAFVNAVRLVRMTPPRVNRYDEGMYYRGHLDNALMPTAQFQIRTDIATTICLNDASDYEGGELVIQAEGGEHRFRGNAGDVIVYPAGFIHEVTEITAGSRLVAVAWIQSQVRDGAQRRLLYDLDRSLKELEAAGVPADTRLPLLQVRSQLVRMWSET